MTGHSLTDNDISVEVRPGWEVEFSELPESVAGSTRSLVHLANFALPPNRGDYGSGAVEIMGAGAALVILTEFEPTSKDAALFSSRGVPSAFAASDFSPLALQRRIPGQSGAQHWFRESDRAFGLYVIVGSSRSVPLVVPEINRALAAITIT